jgi:hypothetical protein
VGSYTPIEDFDAAIHDGVPIEFVGTVTEVRPTRDRLHLRIFTRGTRSDLLIFIPSTTLELHPELWDLRVGETYVFRGEGELYRDTEEELILRGNDPMPQPMSGSGAADSSQAAGAAPGVQFGQGQDFAAAYTQEYDPVIRAAADDAQALDLERRYERIAATQLLSHAAEVEGRWRIQLSSGLRSGTYRLTQQWTKPDAWHVLGSHEGSIPAEALSEGDSASVQGGRSLVVVGSEGCFALYQWGDTATGQERSLQFATPRSRWDEMLAEDRGNEAGWLFMATGALPIHNPFALFEAGSARMDGTGTEEGQPVVYVRGTGRYLRDYPPTLPQRPSIRLGFLRDSLQLSSIQAGGSGFEVSGQIRRFTSNYNPSPSQFRAPTTPAPFVSWGMLGRSPLIAGGRRLNREPFVAGGLQLVFYPGFSVLMQ